MSGQSTNSPAPILWLMGPTSAGKSTIARHLVRWLRSEGRPAIQLDGDQVRSYFQDLIKFGVADRMRVVGTLVDLAQRTAEAGLTTVVAALTAHDEARRLISEALPMAITVYITCPIRTCIERDPKGLYKKALNGEIQTLIGYNDLYQPPEDPDLSINTEGRSVDECVADIINYLTFRFD